MVQQRHKLSLRSRGGRWTSFTSGTRMKCFQREGLWHRTQLFLTSRRVKKKKERKKIADQTNPGERMIELAAGQDLTSLFVDQGEIKEKRHERSCTTQHLYSYWLKSLIWRTKVVSEGWGGLHLNAFLSWAGWLCGRRRTGARSSVDTPGRENNVYFVFNICTPTQLNTTNCVSGFKERKQQQNWSSLGLLRLTWDQCRFQLYSRS